MKVLSLIGNLTNKQVEEIKKELKTNEIAISYLSEINPSLNSILNSTYLSDIEEKEYEGKIYDSPEQFVSKYVSPATYSLIVFPDNFYNMFTTFRIISYMAKLKKEQLIAILYKMPDEGFPSDVHIKFIFTKVNGKKEIPPGNL